MYARLNSFTLMELLVAMIISGIVMSMAAYAYFRLSEWYASDAHQQEYLHRIHLLETALRSDIRKCEHLKIQDSVMVLGDSTRYQFGKQLVVREHPLRTDSFVLSSVLTAKEIEWNGGKAACLDVEISGRREKYRISFLREIPYESQKK